MIDSPDSSDPLEPLAEEFATRCRRGESPSISEYAERYPQHAEEIEELFPAVVMMEQLRAEEKARREAAARQTASAKPPQHLGDFDIVQEIGRGGMGVVYEAEQRSLARRVAVKVLPKHVFLLDRHVRRFQREARTAAKLHHTNIVPVFGVGDQDGLHYYVMPLIRGAGLDEIIRNLRNGGDSSAPGAAPRAAPGSSFCDIRGIVRARTAGKFTSAQRGTPVARPGSSEDVRVSAHAPDLRRDSTRGRVQAGGAHKSNGRHGGSLGQPGPARPGPRTSYWQAVARIGVQAAEALGFAHGRGTLHRDIKPGNLLVDEDGVVRVADFGLASAVDMDDPRHQGEVVGTPRYMAPEQLGGAADARSDIYALGLTLYEMLTLRAAFEDSDRRGCPDGRATGLYPVRPRKINGAIPRDLEAIVLKCIACEPSRRYQHAAALEADLRRFLEDKPVRARRPSPVERAWRWCRRNPALAAMSALAAGLVVAVAAVALAGYAQTRRAYADTKAALARAEATSGLALDVLDNIYLQLSPERAHIASDSDAGGEACACIGLRSSAGPASPVQRKLMQVQASKETAALLAELLVFYDRLAEQAGSDFRVVLESAVASRRVGDIRRRLGQIDQAEREYTSAVQRLEALRARPDAGVAAATELARCYNEIGNVRSARLEFAGAYEAHQKAFSVLQSVKQTDGLPREHRYELARTLYFISSKGLGALGSQRGRDLFEKAAGRWQHRYDSKRYRKWAISILEKLAQEDRHASDYRFLLALCYRPPEAAPDPVGAASGVQGRQRAIRILQKLTEEHPDVADYRYELIATYAWIHVSLFPWQGPSAVPPRGEENLRKALEESQWLVTHHPTVPHYACSQALILAKLGTVCWRTGRLAEAERLFRKALETQSTITAEFPDLPSHNRVLREFLRLRLGQVCCQCSIEADDPRLLVESRALLMTCVENLTELTGTRELAEDRLALTSLPVAREALSDVLARIGNHQKVAEAPSDGPHP